MRGPLLFSFFFFLLQGLTFKAHVTGIESYKSRLSHVAGEVLCKGFWVSGREGQHLFVHRQRGEDPAGETEQRRWVFFFVCFE